MGASRFPRRPLASARGDCNLVIGHKKPIAGRARKLAGSEMRMDYLADATAVAALRNCSRRDLYSGLSGSKARACVSVATASRDWPFKDWALGGVSRKAGLGDAAGGAKGRRGGTRASLGLRSL